MGFITYAKVKYRTTIAQGKERGKMEEHCNKGAILYMK